MYSAVTYSFACKLIDCNIGTQSMMNTTKPNLLSGQTVFVVATRHHCKIQKNQNISNNIVYCVHVHIDSRFNLAAV